MKAELLLWSWPFFMVSHLCRYFQYKRVWDMFKLPGEADRTALRLEIKVADLLSEHWH